MAIRFNNAGIVEAIKSKSGSAKFYRPSFEGIIQAIQDWGGGGGGGTEVLPGGGSLPNTDQEEGNLVVIPDGDGNYFMYVYAGGSWEKLHITTSEVMEAGTAPFSITTPDGRVLTSQQDVNIYLAEAINNISEKGYDDGPIKAEFEADQERQDKANLAADALLEAQILGLANKTDQDQAEQDKKIKELGNEIDELSDSVFGSCEYEDKTGTLVEYDGKGGIQYSTAGKKIYLNQYANMGWPEPSSETEITINGDVHEVVGVGVVSGHNYFYQLKEGISGLLNTEVTVSLCTPNPSFVTQEEFAEDQKRQDDVILEIQQDINKYADPDDNSVSYRFVTHPELQSDQNRQDDEWAEDQERQDEEIEKRVLKAGDTMTGHLIVKADVHANRVRTLNVDSGENSNLLLKHNGETKVYVGGIEVTVQNPLKLNTEGVDPRHVVTKGYIDALDAKQAAEISTLEYKLDALLGLTFQGTYEFKHDQTCEERYQECMANCTNDARCEQDCVRDYSTCEQNNVEPGFFEAIDPDGQFDHLQEIIISKNDKSGIEVDWSGVLKEGDYLEVDHVFAGQLDKTNYGLYRITEEPVENTNSKGEETYDLKLEFLQGDGVLNPQELYEIRGITAAEGINPEELGDFLLKDDAAALYAPLSHTHNDYLRQDFSIYKEVG